MNKILVAGASGFIGTALVSHLRLKGYRVFTLVRKPAENPQEIFWDPSKQFLHPDQIEEFDAVINLSGESISEGRWDAIKKKQILESRIQTTQLLAKTIAKLAKKPAVLVNASAIGFYGDTKDQWVSEESSVGTGFLADVCQQWENETTLPAQSNVRVVKLRIGVVLSSNGGALKKMLLPFKLGLGGVIGSGKQYMSWIALDDLLNIIETVISNDSYKGAVNAVTENPVTNREFTKTLGRVLHRPTLFPMPAFVAKLIFGEVADALLLSGCRVKPAMLQQHHFSYKYPALKDALEALV